MILKSLPVLTTARLKLRQVTLDDDQEIFIMRSNNEVNKLVGRKNCESIEEARDFIRKITATEDKTGYYWAIDLISSNSLAGTICLFNFDDAKKKCEMGFELLPDFQGQGIMKEAAERVIDFVFQILNLNEIDGYTHPANSKSIKILERLKFRKLPESDQVVSEYIIYSLTKSDLQIAG